MPIPTTSGTPTREGHSMCACALAVSLAVSLAPPPQAIDPTRKRALAAAEIAALVRQLGDDRFEKREAASRALAEAGEPALSAVRKASSSDDPEVRRRATRVLVVLKKHAIQREWR